MDMFKRSRFWVCCVVFSLAAAFFSYQYMNKVYSLVNLSISADRSQVLADAKNIAQELSWDITDYQNVTSFESEDDLQCFVELEAGGKDAFVAMFESGAYHPYHWHVRFFKEQQVVEMHAWFSPQGTRLGFAQKISQQSSGAALTKEQAQKLIEAQIHTWCANFDDYSLIEYDSEVRDTGRIDHDFTYERKDLMLGKGTYRCKAVVCGDVITKIEPSVKIPDNFMRRYKQMRSANNLLAAVGSFFFRSLYLLFFCLFGLVIFYRRNYLLSKKSSIAAAIVSGGMFLRGLNEFELWWTSYNTVQSSSAFVATKLFEQIISSLSLFGLIFITLGVAEAASRYVYKKHIQFFQIFNYEAFSSLQVFQQVLFGYLMVPFMFAYVVIFGYCMKTYFLWWSPAGSLFDPNVVACYFPWLSAITISLQAGFFEEVVCRALPLAMMAVLTRESKNKKIWFSIIFIVQALIFGACHANYPNQPFYARLIELILPSFGFGWMYLKFGLLPGVITHFVYDVVWFAMPIFSSNLVWSKVMVVVCAGLPLWIVCLLYLYQKKLISLPAVFFNKAFVQPQAIQSVVQPRQIGKNIPAFNIKIIMILGLCSLITWVMTYKFSPDVRSLMITKSQAINRAQEEIVHKFGAVLDETWTPIAIAQDDCSRTATRFVWQVYGKDIYNLALGFYLTGIHWMVRFVKFSGQVEDRGQEYMVVVTTNRDQQMQVVKAQHVIPEHFAGEDINQDQALAIVYDFVAQEYFLQQEDLKLISINSDKFEHRRDWTIVLQDMQIFDFPLEGQARIKIKVSGDKVSDYSRFIFVPENWSRADQEKLMNLNLVKTGLWFLMFLLMVVGLIFGVHQITSSKFGVVVMRHKGLFVATVSIIYAINSMSLLIGDFNTSEPFYDQLTRISLGMVTQISYQVLFCSIFLAIGAVGFIKAQKTNFLYALLLSSASACIFLAISSLLSFFQMSLQPVCGYYQSVSHYVPAVSFAVHYIKLFYLILALIIAMFIVLTSLRNLLPGRIWIQIVSTILFCFSFQAIDATASMHWMFLYGCVMGSVAYLIFCLLLQYDMTLISLMFANVVIGMIIPEVFCPSYVGASFHGLCAIFLIVCIAFYFYQKAHKE